MWQQVTEKSRRGVIHGAEYGEQKIRVGDVGGGGGSLSASVNLGEKKFHIAFTGLNRQI